MLSRKIMAFFAVFVFLNCFCPMVFGQALIVDHTAVQQFDTIPDQWIEAAKSLTIHFAHTSHGSQIITGCEALELIDPKYSFAVRKSYSTPDLPPEETPPALRMYDGNPPDTYITPEKYWDGTTGLNMTRAVVDTGNFNYSMWSWCGQQSYNSEAVVQSYLNTLDSLESQYPQMRFIYMTGHVDGGGATLDRNNQMVRDYVAANNKILYDFQDIENHDPDGNHYPNTRDTCDWCDDWCNSHPDDCDFECGSCAHSDKFNCLIKAKAFWWMMARLAGWDPSGGSNNPPVLDPVGNKTVSEGSTLAFGVSASDPDNDNTEISVTGLPSGATFNAISNQFSWTPEYTQSGVYHLTFTATDDGFPVMEDSESVDILVSDVLLRGDVNGNGMTNLEDVILSLKTLAGLHEAVLTQADIDGDEKIGLEEVLYIIQLVSEIRS